MAQSATKWWRSLLSSNERKASCLWQRLAILNWRKVRSKLWRWRKNWLLCHQPLEDEEIDLRLQPFDDGREVLLRGWLVKRYQSGLVRARSGAIRSEDLLAAWIDHLCLAASGKTVTTHLIGYERKEGVQHQMLPPLNDAQQAKTLLSELVALFCQGMNQPLAYFPENGVGLR